MIRLKFVHPSVAAYVPEELLRNEVRAISSGSDQPVLEFKPGLLLHDATCDEVQDRAEGALSRRTTSKTRFGLAAARRRFRLGTDDGPK